MKDSNTIGYLTIFKTDCQPNILKAGDCPIGFAKSADTCYFVGRWKKTRTSAKVSCEYL